MADQLVQEASGVFQKALNDIEGYMTNWAQGEHAKIDAKAQKMREHAAKKLEGAITDVASGVTSGGIIGEIEAALGLATPVPTTAPAAPAAPVPTANPPQPVQAS